MTTPEANQAVVRRVFDELVNEGRYEVIPELYDPAMIDHDPAPGSPEGLPAIEHTIRQLRTAFPDLRVTLDDLVAAGDRVAMRGTWRGTNTGSLMGRAKATGKAAEWRGHVIFRFTEDGRIVERWGLMDITSMLQQLGVVPPAGAGPREMISFVIGRIRSR